jgi:hypothetical protein
MVSGSRKRDSGTSSELKLLRALIDRSAGSSPPSRWEVERGLERGLGRLMSLEVRLREQASREGIGEDHDLIEEIRAIREAVTELRARMNAGESSPLAQGFVIPRGPGLGGGDDPPMVGSSPAAGRDGAGAGPRQQAYAVPAVERHAGVVTAMGSAGAVWLGGGRPGAAGTTGWS